MVLKDVGAGLRLAARRIGDGRYRLDLSVSDGSLAATDGVPRVRRSRRVPALLQEGETVTVASAVDPQTGDVVEAEVTIEAAR